MHIVHGKKKILKKGEKFIFLELTKGRSLLEDQRGDRSPQIPPLHPPMGSGVIPRGPQERYLSKWEDIKNAPRGKCRLRTAVSAIIVGDGAHDVPSTTSNVHLRYPKNQPLLLPGLKNAASAAS